MGRTLPAAFIKHGAEFVLVGGVAGQAYGATRVTNDLDLCPRWSAENLERVAAALRDLGADGVSAGFVSEMSAKCQRGLVCCAGHANLSGGVLRHLSSDGGSGRSPGL